ncbi:TonB-dependent receptor family protein [Vibrio splendidus]|uniref:TonB-dependent receptor n=1 Tax=Vibrio splendidus TaxID=29497 RepID=A0A2N7FQC4_VIBSP|nr:TonB-dependent receptor [Vibrio splendidus]PMJ71493.1 TonB-dependent receptor [Vibrio splendidus]
MNKSLLAVAVASLLSPISNLHAQEASTDETMVVLARSNNVNTIADVPSNIVIIDRTEIEQSGANSLESLLRGRAGIQISDSNSGAAFSLRGFSGEQASSNTLILLDGRRLNSQDLVAPNLNFIQLKDIETIEVLSGSAGVLYGDQAVGGVINIVTRTPSENATSVGATYGSFNTTILSASTSGSVTDEVSYRFSATQNNSDNYRDHNDSENGSILGLVEYRDETRKLFVEVGYYDTERQYAGSLTEDQFKEDPTQANTAYPDDFNHEITRSVRLGYDQKLNQTWTLKNEIMFDDMSGHGLAYGTDKKTESGQLFYAGQFEGTFDSESGARNLIVGLDLLKSHYDYASPWTDRDNEQESVNIYTRYSHPLTQDLTVNIGGRYAKVEDRVTDMVQYPDGQDLDNDATAYELSANYRINDKSRVYIRTESNFRFAKVSEQSYTFPGVVGLKPQTGISNEFGWNWNDDIFSFRADFFNLQLEDEIVYVTDPSSGSGRNANADASTRNGATLAGDYYVFDDLLLSAEYSYVDAEFTEGVNDGKDVAWVANHTGRVALDYSLTESLGLYTDAVYTGDKYRDGDNSNSLDKLDAYWLVNLAVNYNYDDLTLSFRTENLLNEKYASYVFYSGWYSGNERAYYLNATYDF